MRLEFVRLIGFWHAKLPYMGTSLRCFGMIQESVLHLCTLSKIMRIYWSPKSVVADGDPGPA
jgi:hypothetical protein